MPNTSDNCNSRCIETFCNNESSSTFTAKKIENNISKNKKTIKTNITEAGNSDDDKKEDYVSSEMYKALEEVTKLHEKNKNYMQIIEVLKKDASQSEELWKKNIIMFNNKMKE